MQITLTVPRPNASPKNFMRINPQMLEKFLLTER